MDFPSDKMSFFIIRINDYSNPGGENIKEDERKRDSRITQVHCIIEQNQCILGPTKLIAKYL